MAVVYLISSTKGCKTYVGSTKNLQERKRGHMSCRNACNSSILIREYGKDNLIFTVLETCTEETRYICEQYWINFIPNTVNKQPKSSKPSWTSGRFIDFFENHKAPALVYSGANTTTSPCIGEHSSNNGTSTDHF
jgi:group I intron endonuclease